MGLDPGHQLPDLRRGNLVQAPAAPVLEDPVPVRPVGPAGPGAHRRRHHRNVLGERGHHLLFPGCGREVSGGQAHPLQQHQCRLDHRLLRAVRRRGRGHGAHERPPSLRGNRGCVRSAWSTTVNVQAASVSSRGRAASSTWSPGRRPQRCRDRDGAPGGHDDHAMGIAADHDDTGVSGQGQPVTSPPVQDVADGLACQAAGSVDPAHPVDRVGRAGKQAGQRQGTASARTAGPVAGGAGGRRYYGRDAMVSRSCLPGRRRRDQGACGQLPAGVFK